MDEHVPSATFDEFFDRHWKKLRRHVAHRFGPNDADDIVQEVMTRAFANFPEVDAKDPWPWLVVVASRIAIDIHRGQKNTSTPGDEVIRDRADPEPDRASADAIRGDMRRRLGRALNQLPPKDRELLVLHDILGVPSPALASLLGLKKGTTRARIVRARKKLKRAYRKAGGPERLEPLAIIVIACVTSATLAIPTAALSPRPSVPNSARAPHAVANMESRIDAAKPASRATVARPPSSSAAGRPSAAEHHLPDPVAPQSAPPGICLTGLPLCVSPDNMTRLVELPLDVGDR